jgi:cobaltochelatase CobS
MKETTHAPKEKETNLIPKLIPEYVDHSWMSQLQEAIEAGWKTLLVGHCGVGKTSAIEQIAARNGVECFRANLNGQTTVPDLIGRWTVKGGQTVWVDGLVPRAMESGAYLILDEVDFAEPEILASLHSLLEDDGKLVLQEKDGSVIYPAEGFRIFGTANSIGQTELRGLYQGTKIMNEAFLDRWDAVLHITWPDMIVETNILLRRVPRLGKATAVLIVKIANEIRKGFEQEQVYTTFSPRRCLQWANAAVKLCDLKESARITVLNKISTEDKEVISNVMQRWIGGSFKE